ncbi:MAG TPA: tripartite tricarboxylate transporter permease [Candidatus Thermoplasmatota archaeon]|nr:tripartite tricarboxylate transporter permease [Candidatus Thermoplasmatota archaeon]
MDALTWLAAALLGTAVGVATGVLPGVHVNTIAAVALGLPALGPAAAVALVAVGTAHAFVQALPGTYLGWPGDEGFSALPAHRLVARGQGPEAVRVTLDAALAGLVAALAAAPAAAWILVHPAVADALSWLAVPVLVATLLLLLASAARKGLRHGAWSAAVLLASGALGWVARDVPLQALFAVPASHFLPLLSGLFGVAGLVAAAQATPPPQDLPRPAGLLGSGLRVPVALGSLASLFTLAMPGLTSASAASWASLGRRDSERAQVAMLSSINTAHLALSLVVLAATGQARTGLAQAVELSQPVSFVGALPGRGAAAALAAAVLAAVLSWRAALWLEPRYRGAIRWLSPKGVAVAGTSFLAVLCLALAGWNGVLLLAASSLLGLVPLRVGVRRIHLTGSLLLPALLARL